MPCAGRNTSSKKSRTPVLDPDEERALLESIQIWRKPKRAGGAVIEKRDPAGLRDPALIYTSAGGGAVLQINVGNSFTQGRRG
jgi:hypothetical protein